MAYLQKIAMIVRQKCLLSAIAALQTTVLFAAADFTPKELSDDLAVAKIGDQGLNQKLLSEGFATAERLPYSHSLLVMKNGKLVAEGYFHGYSAASPNNIKSVTKSITSTLVGIAIDKKLIQSIDTPVGLFFPKNFSKLKDTKASRIKLKHLLTMSAGFDANDDLPDLNTSAYLDHAEAVFERPLIHSPGEVFSYTSAYVDALSQVLTHVSKKTTRTFAEENLFDPLGIKVLGWSRDGLGYYLGESDLFLTSRDLLKFGQMILDKGKYQNRQIVSEQWINAATTAKIQASAGNGQYGYLWWIKNDVKTPFIYAWGYGGQYIYVVPSKRMVVVMTNDFNEKRPQKDIRSIIEDYVIASAD